MQEHMTQKLHIVVLAFTAWMIIACVWNITGTMPNLLFVTFMKSWYVLWFLGVAISLMALVKSKKRPYWFFLIYYSLGLYSVTFAPYVNRSITAWLSDPPDVEAIALRTQLDEEIDNVYKKYDMSQVAPKSLVITFNAGHLLILVGLWLMVRKDIEHAPPEGRGEAPRP